VALLTVSVALGIIGPRLRPTARLASITTHRAASALGAALIAAHVVLAVLDAYVPLDWPAALVPGVAAWERWGVALGALAVDLLAALLLTTIMRLRAPWAWRRVHLVAYPVWMLAVTHGLLVGSDGTAMRWLAVSAVGVVAGAVSARLLVAPRHAASPASRELPVLADGGSLESIGGTR
ncbi:MAG TPA: hypothetical protein VF143_05860, partial [Candidatus Nanopelagicales bacterium]